MARMLKNRFVLLAGLLVLCFVQYSIAAEGSSQMLVSPKLLEHANLKILWENKLSIKNNERLEQMLILGNSIYAISNKNYMVSLNKENGDIIFRRVVAPEGLPVSGLKLYEDELISIVGTKLIEIDPKTGNQLKADDVGFVIACPAARNSSYFYLSGADKRLHTLRADDKVQIFKVAADNDSMITSILAHDISVIFGTDAGNVVSIAPDRPRKLWQFDASGGIAGPIVRDEMSLFFASKDTNVYRVDMVGLPLKRQLIWKYQTAGVLDREPRVTQQVIYQYVLGKGVTAIDKESGQFMWSVPGGVDLLAEAKGRAYIITKDRKLVVMDNLTAKKLYSVNFAEVTRHTANTIDSKIYIADEHGRIACLQPVK
ncbi:MAG: PQQ-binding-like beta-propeller repeat protein [Sedimentisphaerales bacterium]|nr:PQQ-binding-like beta-propeller repeat protein [Sedimentisphaerales bacterium]